MDSKELKELIEKLKDPKQAQPFWMRTWEEQEILGRAGADGCLLISSTNPQGRTPGAIVTAWSDGVYILKPDYKPEPEYGDIPIILVDGRWMLETNAPHSQYSSLEMQPGHEGFVCFWSQEVGVGENIPIDLVAVHCRKNRTVYARYQVAKEEE